MANSCLLFVPLGARESVEREKERERERESRTEKMHDCGARKIDDLNNIL